MSISRATLAEMDRDQLIEVVLELDRRLEDLESTVEGHRHRFDQRTETSWNRIDDLKEDLHTAETQLHRERSRLSRRVAALEGEIGITATDALATAEAGEDGEHLTKLGRLVRHGPDAVSEQPGATLHRARELVENWNRWGTIRDDALGRERRLASKKHDLLTHLQDTRDEPNLRWQQVYRAMEWVAENSGENVKLQSGSQDEGKYVLVHRIEEGSDK